MECRELDGVGCWMAIVDLDGHHLGGDIALWPKYVGCGQFDNSGQAPPNRYWLWLRTFHYHMAPRPTCGKVLTGLQVLYGRLSKQ